MGATVDFQASASQQGRSFEEAVEAVLVALGWTIIDRHFRVAGAEIDIVAANPEGTLCWIECKGSHRGKVPGSRRSDTVKKAIGVAWYLAQQPERLAARYVLATSHLPKPGGIAARMLDAALTAGLFDKVWSLPSLDFDDEEDTHDDD